MIVVSNVLCQVATHKAVYGGLDFALAKGVGWVRAGLVWLYNFVVLMTSAFLCKLLD
jgi:H+-transporting ATPase